MGEDKEECFILKKLEINIPLTLQDFRARRKGKLLKDTDIHRVHLTRTLPWEDGSRLGVIIK